MNKTQVAVLRPYAHDLFGEVPVYPQDIDCWLLAVPKIEPGSPRAEAYIKTYDVISKIKNAKKNDEFEDIAGKVSNILIQCQCQLRLPRNLHT